MFLATAASLVIGAHVATMHPPESSGPEYNDFNPGVYVKFDTEAVSSTISTSAQSGRWARKNSALHATLSTALSRKAHNTRRCRR